MDNTTHQIAKKLAHGRKTQNWLAICLVLSGLTNIAVPVYFWNLSHAKNQVVVFDLASGSLLLSPMVDPSDSKEILEIQSSWMVKSILDRSPSGFDNDKLIPILFDVDTARKVKSEWDAPDPKTGQTVKQQYIEKNLRTHVEIKSFDCQPVSSSPRGPYIAVRVVGQCVINGVWGGKSIPDVQPVILNLKVVPNPDLGRNHHYPLMCFEYSYENQSENQNITKK